MQRLGLLAALLAVAVAVAACERSDKPTKGVYMGAGGGVSMPS